MAKIASRSNPALTASQPPRTLGNSGLSLWNRIMSEYRIEDCGGPKYWLRLAKPSTERKRSEAKLNATAMF